MSILSKKALTGALGALAIAATLSATATPASAKWGRNAALFGGLAAGALVAGAVASNAYAAPVHGYGYGYAPECWRETRAVYNRWGGFVGYRSIRVCE